MGLSIKLESISKRFTGGDVLKNINLELEEGRIIALLGLNGAGKSTLMQILAGHLAQTSGKAQINGPVAMVHQELSLLLDLSIAENIILPRLTEFKTRGYLNWTKVRKAARQSLEKVGLNIDVSTQTSSLTTGEAQLVEIARALDQKARILILDEPTSALSRKECERLFEILRQLVKNSGQTVLFVSHRLDEVKELADHVVVLRDGVIAGSLSGANIDSASIVELMTGQAAVIAQPISSRPQENRPYALTAQDFLVYEKKLQRTLARISGSLEIPQGSTVGIAGLMGSGRSVLLRGLASKLRPAAGGTRIPLGDLKTKGKVTGPASAFLHEDRKNAGLFMYLSALENVAYGSHRERFASKAQTQARHFYSALRVRGARDAEQLPASVLSGGNQQKLLLARALYSDASLWLLDEPTRGIDAAARGDIYKTMRTFTQSGKTILWVSSDLEELVTHSDYILRIRRGELDLQPLRELSGSDLAATIIMEGKA